MSKKLDSMWWHEAPKNGPLASSHIAVLFCALVKNNMIVKDLLSLEFEGIPNDFSNRSLSPMEYCLAYIDGELFSSYIKAKYRENVVNLLDDNKFYNIVADESFMSHIEDSEFDYTLKCTWGNVDILANWLQQHIAANAQIKQHKQSTNRLKGLKKWLQKLTKSLS